MNAADLLAELRPPLDDSPADDATLERILLAGPEPSRSRSPRPYRRPLAVAAAAAAMVTAGVALVPSDGSAPVGLERAVAALADPEVLLHFKVVTKHLPSGATESAESWQTPDGRRARTILGPGGVEWAYDQRRRILETYHPGHDEILVDTDPEFFEDQAHPFGSIATAAGSPPFALGDLPALLESALGGRDPKIRHVGRTTIRGIDVDHVRVERDLEVADVKDAASRKDPRSAPRKTITIVRDVYVRHDNALPVRVVDHLGSFGTRENTMDVSEFGEARKLTLDASTEPALQLADHPGARRTVRGPFKDSAAGRRGR